METTSDAPVDATVDTPSDPDPPVPHVADVRHQARERRRRRRRRRRMWTAACAALPWSWLVIRPLGGPIEFVAVALPLIVGGAAVGLVCLAALLRRTGPAFVAASTLVLGLGCIVGPWRPADGGGPIAPGAALSVVAVNVGHATGVETVEAIRARGADVVVVEEVTPEVDRALTLVYPYFVRSPDALVPWTGRALTLPARANQAGTIVYSRYALEELADTTGLPYGLPGVRVRVDAPGGPIVLYGLHLTKASPTVGYPSVSYGTQATVAAAVRAAAEREVEPVIIAGDLNLVDRQEAWRSFSSGWRDAVRAGRWAGPTSAKDSLAWRALLARIDHVLVTPTLCAASGDRFPVPGSDHRGVAATVGQCAT